MNLLLLLAFGLKAAVFPLFFWLPDSYPTAASPVTAVFAGLLTKIGVYALIRTETLLFPGEQRTLLLVIAALTMIVGGIGALAHREMKRILSFHIVSQIGYMIFGLGLGTVRPRGDGLLPRAPHSGEDFPVPRRGHHRGRDRVLRARSGVRSRGDDRARWPHCS